MEIKQVVKYEVDGEVFDTEEDAYKYTERMKFKLNLNLILNKFCYRDMDQDDVFEGIVDHKDEILDLLIKNQEV